MCVASSLSVLFSKSLNKGVFPNNLKIARISDIYKGKGSRSNPDHYRPMSILPVPARLFQSLVHLQLYAFMKDTLSKCQPGFKPGHLAETSLLNTTNSWIMNIENGLYNLILFLDLRKAFDTVNQEILLKS